MVLMQPHSINAFVECYFKSVASAIETKPPPHLGVLGGRIGCDEVPAPVAAFRQLQPDSKDGGHYGL